MGYSADCGPIHELPHNAYLGWQQKARRLGRALCWNRSRSSDEASVRGLHQGSSPSGLREQAGLGRLDLVLAEQMEWIDRQRSTLRYEENNRSLC